MKSLRRWWREFRRWRYISTWKQQCRYCGAIDTGYSYGLPDRGVYFDCVCNCRPALTQPEATR